MECRGRCWVGKIRCMSRKVRKKSFEKSKSWKVEMLHNIEFRKIVFLIFRSIEYVKSYVFFFRETRILCPFFHFRQHRVVEIICVFPLYTCISGNKHLISLLLFPEAPSSRHNMCCSVKFHVGNTHRISLLLFPESSGTAKTSFSPYMSGNKHG